MRQPYLEVPILTTFCCSSEIMSTKTLKGKSGWWIPTHGPVEYFIMRYIDGSNLVMITSIETVMSKQYWRTKKEKPVVSQLLVIWYLKCTLNDLTFDIQQRYCLSQLFLHSMLLPFQFCGGGLKFDIWNKRFIEFHLICENFTSCRYCFCT